MKTFHFWSMNSRDVANQKMAEATSVNSFITAIKIVTNPKVAFIIGLFIGVFIVRCQVKSYFMMLQFQRYNYEAESNCHAEIPHEYVILGLKPIKDCNYCTNVTQIDIIDVKKLKKDNFVEYAYSGRPLMIKNAAKKWKALNIFTLNFFQDLNAKDQPNDLWDAIPPEICEFFPYNSSFESIEVNNF